MSARTGEGVALLRHAIEAAAQVAACRTAQVDGRRAAERAADAAALAAAAAACA